MKENRELDVFFFFFFFSCLFCLFMFADAFTIAITVI